MCNKVPMECHPWHSTYFTSYTWYSTTRIKHVNLHLQKLQANHIHFIVMGLIFSTMWWQNPFFKYTFTCAMNLWIEKTIPNVFPSLLQPTFHHIHENMGLGISILFMLESKTPQYLHNMFIQIFLWGSFIHWPFSYTNNLR